VLEFLLSRGVRRVVGLCYSHRPGLARGMNRYMAALQAAHPQLVGLGTALPGEPDAAAIVREAFDLGLRGIKLHCHVQVFSPDDPSVGPIADACAAAGRPLVIHAGREPRASAYRVDPHLLCRADRTAAFLANWPRLQVVVPHLGVDEFSAYGAMLERFDNLWLDTTMVVGGYFPFAVPPELLRVRPERILYGSDFPNLPYAWDRELRALSRAGLDDDALAALLGGNADRLFPT
jgi:predicted TIM-barrel fold metal-dependent hydrolase